MRSLEMNGRIIALALDAYDTDGLQGIYCPEPSAVKNNRAATNDAISTAGTTFGALRRSSITFFFLILSLCRRRAFGIISH